MDPKEAAHKIISHVQDAVGDIYVSEGDLFSFEEPLRSELAEVVHSNQREIIKRDCFADILYSDVDTVLDLSGDRIFDEANGDTEAMLQIAKEIINIEGETSTFGKAMNKFVIRHS